MITKVDMWFHKLFVNIANSQINIYFVGFKSFFEIYRFSLENASPSFAWKWEMIRIYKSFARVHYMLFSVTTFPVEEINVIFWSSYTDTKFCVCILQGTGVCYFFFTFHGNRLKEFPLLNSSNIRMCNYSISVGWRA